MAELNDMALLAEYGRSESEEAFAHLVKRHVDLVYSVALRHVHIPAHAEEITQGVFIILARKAGSLGHLQILEGWLHETTRLTALNFLRGERRRQLREQEAYMESSLQNQPDTDIWKSFAPLLDEGMAQLNSKDRDALILRFFKDRSVREVAAAMGLKESAAQLRILRAVEKLRLFFSRRGVVVPAAAVAAAITAHSVQAAPGTLALSVTAFAAAKGTAASTSTLTLIKGALKTMAWAKAQTGVATAIVAAAFIVPVVVQHQAQAKLADGEAAFQQQHAELAKLRADNERLSQLASDSKSSQSDAADLQRLQKEVGTLRQQASEVAALQAENKQLRTHMRLDQPKPAGQISAEAHEKVSFQRQWLMQFIEYAANHDGQFPTNYAQAEPYTPNSIVNNDAISTNQFDIVYTGTRATLTNAPGTIVLREKDAWNAGDTSHPPNQWAKIYGFADGHVEIHHEPVNNFDAYESQHIVASSGDGQ